MESFDGNSEALSQDQFAMALIEAIQQIKPSIELQYDELNFRIVDPEKQFETNLGNIYHEHCRLTGSERSENIKRLAQIFSGVGIQISNDGAEARQHLRPKIWSRSTFEELELQRRIDGESKPLTLPLYPLGSHLYSSLVYDLPTSMRSVTMDEISSWGLTIYEALEIAAENLQQIPINIAQIGEGLYCFTTSDNYDSARILLTNTIRGFEIQGEPIAVVPQRDACFVCGSEDSVSLSIMLELTKEVVRTEPRPLSPLPLILQGDEWEDWLPSPDHPLFAGFHSLKQDFYGSMYRNQQESLETFLKQQGESTYVSSFTGIQSQDNGRILSYCVWPEGVDCLLPETDLIMLPSEHNFETRGHWEDVRRIVGSLMQRHPDYYPPRYRVREFPSRQQLHQIGSLNLKDLL